jgi:uncharacterized membrane protein
MLSKLGFDTFTVLISPLHTIPVLRWLLLNPKLVMMSVLLICVLLMHTHQKEYAQTAEHKEEQDSEP